MDNQSTILQNQPQEVTDAQINESVDHNLYSHSEEPVKQNPINFNDLHLSEDFSNYNSTATPIATSAIEQMLEDSAHLLELTPDELMTQEMVKEAVTEYLKDKPKVMSHSIRLYRLATLFAVAAKAEGLLTETEARLLPLGAFAHDLGKHMIKDSVLNKQAKLNDYEWEEMRRHASDGSSLLKHVVPYAPLEIYHAIMYHHERPDGTGYPFGLMSNKIPATGSAISILDAFDCMVFERYHRPGNMTAYIQNEFVKGRGTQFDTELDDLFINYCLVNNNLPPEYKEKIESNNIVEASSVVEAAEVNHRRVLTGGLSSASIT